MRNMLEALYGVGHEPIATMCSTLERFGKISGEPWLEEADAKAADARLALYRTLPS